MKEQGNILFYSSPNGDIKVDVILKDETVWLTIEQMSSLFGKAKSTINEHILNIFKENELLKNDVCRKIGNSDFSTKPTNFYNLDVIISVGYRVKSVSGTQFRIWATKRLKEYIIKGFTMDDDRLKQGSELFGKDYFKELLERIRSIRTSERRIYLQITDIFQECSIDYNKDALITKQFFATIQNKFHFAITHKTAAEIIYTTVDNEKKNMGLTTWKSSPEGRILKSDTTVAKNYLSEKEINKLERTISSYFDYIENIIENRTSFTMETLSESVNKFLSFNEYKILKGNGKISTKNALDKASKEYDIFNKTQEINSDFEKSIKRLS